jgi:hypothetical protein
VRGLKYIAVIVVAVSAVLSAAAVWEEKPFTQWAAKDVEKVLTESPWAGKASITHEKAGADLGPVPDWKVIISVRSATPIRQALARQQLIAGGTASPELEANLATPHPRYAFAIAGIPQFYRTQLAKSAQAATMKVKGMHVMATEASVLLFDKEGNPAQPPAGPGGPGRGRQQASTAVQIVPVAQRGGGGGGCGGGGGGFGGGGFGGGFEDKSGITATLFLEFPKGDPITPTDGEVEVSTVIGGYQIKKAFKLKEMVFRGALAF